MADCAVEIRGLTTRYGTQFVHRDLDLCVKTGEILGLVGGSGSGKTTLLRHVLGLETPQAGEVRVFGRELRRLPGRAQRQFKRRWGVLFQGGALFSALSVYDNVALPLRELRALDEAAVRDLVMLKLSMVEIEARQAHKMPSEISGGMVKRVALARALALEPELLFLDEPTAGLDPVRAANFVTLIRQLHERQGFTVVMITHDLDTLAALSQRVAVLADRRVISVASLEETRRLEHPFVREFFRAGRAGLVAVGSALPV